jgi:hypothetical protein
MKEALKLLLAFAPWFAFWFIAGPSMFRLRVGIIVAAVLVVVMAVTKLHRGAILWAGYVFFAFALISVVWLENVWVIRHLGILATGTLFVSAQLSILLGRPFTEDYAREHVPEELWNSASFIRGCYTTTAVWSCIFFVNCMLNVVKLSCSEIPEWIFSLSEYSVILMGIIFTNIYSRVARKKRQSLQNPISPSNP